MTIEAQVGLAGKYKIEAFKTDANGVEIPGTRRTAADWFDNLITDGGLHYIGTNTTTLSNGFGFCRVGSGSTAPANTDTALVSQVAVTSTVQTTVYGVASTAPYYGYTRKTFRFATGAATGNLSEVGVSFTTAGTLLSRALIKDGSGNPTTITVLSDESLDVVYELRFYAPTADTTATVTIGGVSTTITVRPAKLGIYQANPLYYADWSMFGLNQRRGVIQGGGSSNQTCRLTTGTTLGANTSLPVTGTVSDIYDTDFTVTNVAYANDFVLRSNVLLDLTKGNLTGGIGTMTIPTPFGLYQIGFSTAVAKDSTKKFSLDLALTYGRYP